MKHNVVKSTLLRFAAAVLLVFGTVPASAQYYMNVVMNNGETIKVAVDDIDSIAFNAEYTLSVSLPKADSVYLATNTDNIYGYGYNRSDITIGEFVLTHSHADWGYGNSFGEAFTFSSCTDDQTPGYTNLSAITKEGVKTNAYFIANAGGAAYEGGLAAEISFKDGKAYKAKECYVTNSTYAYLAIKDQNVGWGSVKEWTAEDVFTLTITGYNGDTKTESIDFLLADGLDIVDTWQKVDLSALGEVTKIQFSLSSTDNNASGMLTPAYFCLDQLTVEE